MAQPTIKSLQAQLNETERKLNYANSSVGKNGEHIKKLEYYIDMIEERLEIQVKSMRQKDKQIDKLTQNVKLQSELL